MGPGIPLEPSLPEGPTGPGGPCRPGREAGREQSSANGWSGVAGAGYVAVLSTGHSVPISPFLSHRPQTGFTLPCLPKLLFVIPLPGSSLHVPPTVISGAFLATVTLSRSSLHCRVSL